MNYKLLITILCSVLFSNICAYAQINGLTLNNKYTKADILTALGSPDEISQDDFVYFTYKENVINNGNNLSILKKIREDYFSFYPEGDKYIFSSYAIFSSDFNFKGIKVGDNINKVKTLGGSFKNAKSPKNTLYLYWSPITDSTDIDWHCCVMFVYDSNGTILSFSQGCPY